MLLKNMYANEKLTVFIVTVRGKAAQTLYSEAEFAAVLDFYDFHLALANK